MLRMYSEHRITGNHHKNFKPYRPSNGTRINIAKSFKSKCNPHTVYNQFQMNERRKQTSNWKQTKRVEVREQRQRKRERRAISQQHLQKKKQNIKTVQFGTHKHIPAD